MLILRQTIEESEPLDRRRERPGKACVRTPSRTVNSPVTRTWMTPEAVRRGSSYVALSRMVAGPNRRGRRRPPPRRHPGRSPRSAEPAWTSCAAPLPRGTGLPHDGRSGRGPGRKIPTPVDGGGNHEDAVASDCVLGVAQDGADVLLIADLDDAAAAQPVLDEQVQVQLCRRHPFGGGRLRDRPADVARERGIPHPADHN